MGIGLCALGLIEGSFNIKFIIAKNLPTILYTLSQYSDGLAKPEVIQDINVPDRMREKITSSYLKGVIIKDLSMQSEYNENIIEMILIKKGIVIVPTEITNTIKNKNSNRRRKK